MNSILFDEECVNGQCYNCNIRFKGNWPAYLAFMKEKYGQEVVDKLLLQSKQVRKFTVEELEQKYHYYIAKVEVMRSTPVPDIMARKKENSKENENGRKKM